MSSAAIPAGMEALLFVKEPRMLSTSIVFAGRSTVAESFSYLWQLEFGIRRGQALSPKSAQRDMVNASSINGCLLALQVLFPAAFAI